jgi:signal transduction histidine kinase
MLGWYPNVYILLTLAVIAFISWLAARALEKALATARQEAEKNRVILNGVADGIVVLDEAGQVVSANPAALSVLDGEMESLLRQAGERVEHAGRVLSFSWAEVAGIGRVAVVRDETRRAEFERAKDAMLATVSHELRTPLNAILGYAEIISLQTQGQPAVAEMAARIKANTGRLKSLVEALLDRAMLEAGAVQVHKAAFRPAELLQQVEGLLSGMAAEQRVNLVLALDPALPDELCGDPQRLNQVLVNLVSNGLKFTDPGEVVSVHLRLERPNWLLEVADTGIGIPPERLPDIFEPFRRGSDFATRRHQGAGLGLSIVRSLVELMGGSIEVQSRVGQDTTFTIRFPLEACP